MEFYIRDQTIMKRQDKMVDDFDSVAFSIHFDFDQDSPV